jgi:hypothetical protein
MAGVSRNVDATLTPAPLNFFPERRNPPAPEGSLPMRWAVRTMTVTTVKRHYPGRTGWVRTRLGSTISIAAAAPLLVLGLAACASTPSTPSIASAANGKTPSAGPSASSATKPDPLKFAQCMREHGVDMPDPDASGRVTLRSKPGDEGKIDSAQKACQQYVPGLGGKGGGPSISKADQAKLLKFAQCMRQHGVPMADPDFSGGGVKMHVEGGGPTSVNQTKAEAAQKACQGLMPAPPDGSKNVTDGGPAAGGSTTHEGGS